MCNVRFNLTKDESREIFDLFWNNYLNFEPSLCRRPCTHTTYEVQLKQVMEVTGYVLIGISFETVVEMTRSKFSTNIMTVLTSLGGSVGQRNLFVRFSSFHFPLLRKTLLKYNFVNLFSSFHPR